RLSGRFQDVTTLGLLACFVVFVVLGFAHGDAENVAPWFARTGGAGALVSVVLVAQIVPYFMTGFEAVAKASEEARPDFDPRQFGRAITFAVSAGGAFYVVIILAVAWVLPWRELVQGHLGTEQAFARAFGSLAIARLILAAACLACVAKERRNGLAWSGVVVSLAIILMKVIPSVPGSFTGSEWVALGTWCGLGLAFWMLGKAADARAS